MLSAIICRVFFSLKIDRKCVNQTEFKRSMCSNMNKETERCFSKFQLAENLKKKQSGKIMKHRKKTQSGKIMKHRNKFNATLSLVILDELEVFEKPSKLELKSNRNFKQW